MVQSISATRTLVLPEYTGQTVGLSWPLVWPSKDPGAMNLDYSLDVSGWLSEIQDTIGSFSVDWGADFADDFAITGAFSHNGVATVLSSGGTAYVAYRVTFTFTSASLGEVLVRTVVLPVEPLYVAAANSYGMVSGSVSGTIE